MLAIEDAFCRVVRETLAGSMIPFSYIFPKHLINMRNPKKGTFSFLGVVKKETFSQNFDFGRELQPVVVWL